MPLNKPYKSIWRPLKNCFRNYGHSDNAQYNNEAFHYQESAAYLLLEKDLILIFEYIEPTRNNLLVYSHRIYELFLKACTEYESLCKKILFDNNYKSKSQNNTHNMNNCDYWYLNNACKLSEYIVLIPFDNNRIYKIQPFKEWANSEKYISLKWYQEFNLVKHNRIENFHFANMLNVLNPIAAVQILLIVQYYKYGLYDKNKIPIIDEYSKEPQNNSVEYVPEMISFSSSILKVILPKWTPSEFYDFNWELLKNDSEPFNKYFAT
jgi:hypothetical protein